ncbi:MAG: porin family protein [Bacteroidetes bacterium]|nr:porin family protein [Bacteroidota bacterium]
MNNFIKRIFLLTLMSGCSCFAFGQGFQPGDGFKQINFGVGVSTWGVPIYVGMDFGVSNYITIGPRLSYRSHSEGFGGNDFDYTIFNLGFRGDYHYGSHIFDLPSQLDLYGGATLGYSVWSADFDNVTGYNSEDSRVYLALQAGARWYFNDRWAVNAELSGGSLSGLDIGLSYKL